MSAFPPEVWRSPLASAIDGRGRAELAAAGRLVRHSKGGRVFCDGDPADAVLVVVNGAVRVTDAAGGELRRALPGELFGLEAGLRAGTARVGRADAETDSDVVELPAHVFFRVLERSAEGPPRSAVLAALRVAKRASIRDAIASSALGPLVTKHALDLILDAGRPLELRRGDLAAESGDPADRVFLVVLGFVRLEGDGRRNVARGSIVKAGGDRFSFNVRAASPALLLSLTASFVGDLVHHAPRLGEAIVNHDAAERRDEGGIVQLPDPFRLETARSLLVIDAEACVRCGHCVSSCASAHDDGIARVARQGERVRLPIAGPSGGTGHVVDALLPSSCQHCRVPSCLGECPTGAIERDAEGRVVIRPDLCTGCGACAKACPWGNIELSPRPKGTPIGTGSALIAVKCDLCAGRAEGPACVASCPVGAIARIDFANPTVGARAFAPGAGQRGPVWLAAGALLGVGVTALGLLGTRERGGGVVVLSVMAALALYSPLKRLLPVRLRPHAGAHFVLGGSLPFLAWQHAGAHGAGLGGAALACVVLASLLGALGSLVHAVLPARLASLETEGIAEGALPGRIAECDGELFRLLTKRNDATKRLYQLVLAPYRESWVRPAVLLITGRRASEEEVALTRRVAQVLEGDLSRVPGIEALVRASAEKPRLRAQRIGLVILRGFFAPHVLLSVLALVLGIAHAAAAWEVG